MENLVTKISVSEINKITDGMLMGNSDICIISLNDGENIVVVKGLTDYNAIKSNTNFYTKNFDAVYLMNNIKSIIGDSNLAKVRGLL